MRFFAIALFMALFVSALARERAAILNTVQSTRRAAKFSQTRTSPAPGTTPHHLNSNFGPLRDRVEADNKKREHNSQRYEEYKKRDDQVGGNADIKKKARTESAAQYVDKIKVTHFKNSMQKLPKNN